MKKNLLVIASLFVLLSACTSIPAGTTKLVSPSAPYTQVPSVTRLPTSTTTVTPLPTFTITPPPQPSFSFVVTSDMSHYSAREYIDYPNFFAGLLGYVSKYGPGDFMISTGDIIPAEGTDWTIDQILGEYYPWFPLPGNHDLWSPEINFFENKSHHFNGKAGFEFVEWGPDSCPWTNYSFDYQNTHFVLLNVYCNQEGPWGIDGRISDTIYDWLAEDLSHTKKEHIFVFGHEPAFPRADSDTGLIRHLGDSLDQYPQDRDRFWALLQDQGVLAYIHGHTHGYHAEKIDRVWQVDAGQAMGARAAPSPGTFLVFYIYGHQVTMQTYRGETGPGFSFLLRDEIYLQH